MAVKDKLISNEVLKAVNDNMQGQVTDLKSALNLAVGAVQYLGGVNTINADTSVDKTKIYINVNPQSGSNYLKMMEYDTTALTWKYTDKYYPVIDRISKVEFDDFKDEYDDLVDVSIGAVPYNGGINSINADASADTSKVYVVSASGANYGKLMRYNSETLRWEYDGVLNKLIDTVSKDEFDNLSSYGNVKREFVHEYVSSGTIMTSPLVDSITFDTVSGKWYHILVQGTYNRFILYGINGTEATELFKYINNSVPNPASYVFENTDYSRCLLVLGYDCDLDIDYLIAESDTEALPQFTIAGVPVKTLFEEEGKSIKTKNIKLPSQTLAGSPANLCLAAMKCICKENSIPDYDGYLYFDDTTQKFYYSSYRPDNPQYVFEWNTALANGEHCRNWAATITADGDVIFLKDHAKANPIVYPHTDYSSPYIVDFGDARKPYAWLVGSSVVQFDDGSFVFGDYAFHSLTDEQNDDRRIIWRVEKPYNDPSNWEQAHSFKHVYYTSNKSDEPDNEIGHIHAIMYDYMSDDLYCTTGDIDRHCRMWISDDHGETWAAVPGAVGTTENTTVQAEGQKWRMTNAVFNEEGIWWGTDAQAPYHKLWMCERDQTGHIDFTTLTEVYNIEMFGLPFNKSQRTYITALCRDEPGLLLLDRGEPRGDKLNLTYYSFKTKKLYIVAEYERATTDAGELEGEDRIGLPMQNTTIYEPQSIKGIVTGGGKEIRPNNTSIFNNAADNYVGAIILSL